MSSPVSDLLAIASWAAIVGGVLWWIWSMRRGSRPRVRTPREEAELAGLRAAIDRGRREPTGRSERRGAGPAGDVE